MTENIENPLISRWQFISLEQSSSTFCVYDSFMKKHRIFHVPFLTDVKIDGDNASVATSIGKIMMLNLKTANRTFQAPI